MTEPEFEELKTYIDKLIADNKQLLEELTILRGIVFDHFAEIDPCIYLETIKKTR
jgi:hypothetical protein